MLDIKSLFVNLKNKNFLRKTSKIINRIENFENSYKGFSEDEFAQKTLEFKQRIANGERVEDILPEAFALVRRAACFILDEPIVVCGQSSTWDMVHYRVQLQAGIALANHMVGEIATGEGKTLIATLPAYLYALCGKGCHIATVNEYLARRDCEWMRKLYSVLGLTCSYIYSGQKNSEKKAAYQADITYGTSAEFGFDYLRDNSMTSSPDEKVQRGFFYCLVDEADSILIDEARTPLIISGESDGTQVNPYKEYLSAVNDLFWEQNKLCNNLVRDVFDKLRKNESISESDIEKLVLVKFGAPRNRVLKQILQMGKVNIEFEKMQTRLTTNFGTCRSHELQGQLYYSVDEKNNTASLTQKGQTFLNPKNKNAFTIPDVEKEIFEIDKNHLISDSEKSDRKENLFKKASEIGERLHIVSQLLRAFALYERDVDYLVRDSKIEIIDTNTGRVMEGRRWSDGLHQAIEAKEHLKVEAENVTYATISIQNYFRMYAHLAGMSGTAKELSDEFLETYKLSVIEIPPNRPCQRKDNPDLIFLTRKEKYNQIINTISQIHSQGRPILVGTGSVEDSELLSRMLKIKNIAHNVLNAKNDANEAMLVSQAGQSAQVTIATNMAGRGTDIKLEEGVNERGGLYIISSEHNYSRRIDRQLMGRCARQGDNGQTQFIISLEDEMLRKYADISPFQKSIKLKHKNGVAFAHPLLSRIIERTQDRIESDYSGARKSMLKFDNPSNKQRGIAYSMRDEIVSSSSLDDFYKKMVSELLEEIVYSRLPEEDLEITQEDVLSLHKELTNFFYLPTESLKFKDLKKSEILSKLIQDVDTSFDNIFKNFDKEISTNLKRFVALKTFDWAWREHITRLEELRNAVFLRGYAQKDPYCEFEKEAFDSFREFLREFRNSTFSNLKNFASGAINSAAIPQGLRAVRL